MLKPSLPNLVLGLSLLAISMPGAQASPSWDAYDLLATKPETWAYHEDISAAGVSGPEDSRTFLMAVAQCSGSGSNGLRISFGSLVSSVYRLYFVRELIPAISAGAAELSVRVDDGELYPLSPGSASIDRLNQVVINGTLASERGTDSHAITELMSGSKATFQVSYNGSLMLTPTFALNNSSEALSKIRCRNSEPLIAGDPQ